MAEGLEHERNKAASSSKPQQAVGKMAETTFAKRRNPEAVRRVQRGR